MNIKILVLAWATSLAPHAFAKTKEIKSQYGVLIPKRDPIALTALQKDFAKYEGKEVVTEGKVTKVCQQRGCWMSLENPSGEVRVMFKNYGFFVDSDMVGKSVHLVGELQKKEISEAEARHYLTDEKASQAEIEKIKGPQTAWQFVASGVKVN